MTGLAAETTPSELALELGEGLIGLCVIWAIADCAMEAIWPSEKPAATKDEDVLPDFVEMFKAPVKVFDL